MYKALRLAAKNELLQNEYLLTANEISKANISMVF